MLNKANIQAVPRSSLRLAQEEGIPLILTKTLSQRPHFFEAMPPREDEAYCYFRSRDGKTEFLGIGDFFSGSTKEVAFEERLERADFFLANHPQKDHLHFFVITPFSPVSALDGFSRQTCILPTEFLYRRGDCITQGSIRPWNGKEEIPFETAAPTGTIPSYNTQKSFCERKDFPEQAQWSTQIHRVIDQIQQRKLEKVVLARRSEFRCEGALTGLQVFQEMLEPEGPLFRYYYGQGLENSFFGASPELLFEQRGTALSTEALAGTALDEASLRSTKNLWEHELVVQDIKKRLSRLADFVQSSSQPELYRLPKLRHLRSRIQAELRVGISTEEILRQLHPSAAICGFPESSARRLIESLEPFDRGFYAGAVGLLNSEEKIFSVALRAVRQEKNIFSFFAGVGIVEGSRAEDEWTELNQKLESVMPKCISSETPSKISETTSME